MDRPLYPVFEMRELSSPAPAGNRILACLPDEARGYIVERAETRPIRAGDILFEEGASITHTIFPHDGLVSLIARMENGRTVEKSLIGPEGFLGFAIVMGGDTVFGRAVVQVAGHALWLSVADAHSALRRYDCLHAAMLRFTKGHMAQLMESIACASMHTARQRVARWLLQAHDRVAGDRFHITQETVATLLALRRATVNEICADLASAGAIAYHRGVLNITDRDRLRDNACECYDRIRTAISA